MWTAVPLPYSLAPGNCTVHLLKQGIKYDTNLKWDVRKGGGYIFETYAGDHPPYHVHIYKGDQFIGRFDIENERPMDGKLPGQVLRYFEELGYKKAQKR